MQIAEVVCIQREAMLILQYSSICMHYGYFTSSSPLGRRNATKGCYTLKTINVINSFQ